MKQKEFFTLFLSIVLLILLSACQAQPNDLNGDLELLPSVTPTRFIPSTPIPTATEKTLRGTLSIRHTWDERQTPALVQIINEFQEVYPDVYFDVLYVPSQDLKSRYENEVSSGKGANILLGPAEWGFDLYEAGLVRDLTGLMAEDRLENLNQAALEAATIQNVLIGVPYSIYGVVLYRNSDIVTLTPNTFDELITLAQTSTSGDTIGAYLERSFYYSGAHLNGLGGLLMNAEGLPAFNNTAGLAWLELLQKFEAAGPVNYFTNDDLELFKEGNVGWIIDGTWNLFQLVDAIGKENLVIDMFPAYATGKLSGYVRSENIYLNPNIGDESLEVSLAFLDFMVTESSQIHISQTNRIPAITNLPLDDTPEQILISQAIAALSEGVPYPIFPQMSVYNIQMDIALRAYFEEGINASEALQNAEENILLELSKESELLTPEP